MPSRYRYESYRRQADLINTIISPGSCCPSLHALTDAAYSASILRLETVENIGVHYAETLREWRRRFHAGKAAVHALGFDDRFTRIWNYYLCYCEAGFETETENCLVLVWSKPGVRSSTVGLSHVAADPSAGEKKKRKKGGIEVEFA